jgi:hypothetical protein
MVVYHYSYDNKVGRKMVISNAFAMEHTRELTNIIPADDFSKLTFSTCDYFNRRLHDHTWSHKRGGFETLGDLGTQHDFMRVCILQL